MKLKIAAALTIAVFSASALAQIYQWKDANGRTVVSDTPPPGSISAKQRTTSSTTTSTPAAAPEKAEAPKTSADRNIDFKKRQQEAKEKSDKAAQEQGAMAEKEEQCRRARQAVATLESSQPVARVGEGNDRQVLDDAGRQAELERAQKVAADACK